MPSSFILHPEDAADIALPPAGGASVFLDVSTGEMSWKDDAGAVHTFVGTPGSPGAPGAPGAAGPPGPIAPVIFPDDPIVEEAIIVPGVVGTVGPAGPTGPEGPAGPMAPIIWPDDPVAEEGISIPGQKGADGVGGGGTGWPLLWSGTAAASATLDAFVRNGPDQSGALIQADFDDYVIRFIGIRPGTNASDLLMRIATGAGPTVDSGANYSRNYFAQSGTTFTGVKNAGLTAYTIANSLDTLANYSFGGVWTLFNPGGTLYKMADGKGIAAAAADLYQFSGGGVHVSTTPATGLQFAMSGGTIDTGTIRVYGVPK